MRMTIGDGVYSIVIEVKMVFMFDNRKGHMIRTTDIFCSCGYAGAFGGGSKMSK